VRSRKPRLCRPATTCSISGLRPVSAEHGRGRHDRDRSTDCRSRHDGRLRDRRPHGLAAVVTSFVHPNAHLQRCRSSVDGPLQILEQHPEHAVIGTSTNASGSNVICCGHCRRCAPESAGSIDPCTRARVHRSLAGRSYVHVPGRGLTPESADALSAVLCMIRRPVPRAVVVGTPSVLSAADRPAPTGRSHRRRAHWATLLVAAGDNPERLRSEAAWAHLCGVAPIPASSGKVARWRLNRGGDRHANSALWVVVITRMNSDPRTRRLRRTPPRRRPLETRDHPHPGCPENDPPAPLLRAHPPQGGQHTVT